MTSISIIGLATYARAVGPRAIEGGHAVEVIGRDGAKAKDLADELGGGATAYHLEEPGRSPSWAVPGARSAVGEGCAVMACHSSLVDSGCP